MKIFDTKFVIESKALERVEIPLNNKVTILTGDSATGKTKLIKFLRLLLSDESEIRYTSINDVCNKVIICESKKEVIDVINNRETNKIIVIDRFDLMSDDDKIINFIDDSSNIFIVAAHKAFKQCGYSTDSMLGLEHDGINYTAYKLFETPADYMFNQKVLI